MGSPSDIFLTLLPILFFGTQAVLLIWTLTDIAKRPVANKPLWIVIIIGLPIIGALGYLLGGRKH